MKKKKNSIRRKMNLFLLGGIVIGFALMTYFTYQTFSSTFSQVLVANMQSSVRDADKLIQSELEKLHVITEIISSDGILSSQESTWEEKVENMSEIFENNQGKYNIISMGLIRNDGYMQVTDGYTGDVSQEYYYSVLMNGEPYVSGVINNSQLNLQTIFLGEPIFDGDEVIGAITCSFDIHFLSTLINDVNYMSMGVAYILDSNGTYIASTDYDQVRDNYNVIKEAKQDENLQELANIHTDMVAGNTGVRRYHVDGIAKVGIYQPVHNTNGWSIAFDLNLAEVSQDVNSAMMRIIIIMALSLVFCGLIVTLIATKLTKQLEKMQKLVSTFATGNFCIKFEETDLKRPDEIGEVYRAIQKSSNEISSILRAFRENVTTLALVSEDLDQVSGKMINNADTIVTSMNEAANGNMDQATSIQEISRTMEQLGESINQVTESVTGIVSAAKNTDDGMQKSEAVLHELSDSLQEFSDMFQKFYVEVSEISEQIATIGLVTGTIQEIATQTNLLALNAAIESARAGEVGKGFAVVAEEIRKLAEESEHSVQEIGIMIGRVLAGGDHMKRSTEEMNQRMMIQQKNLESTLTEFEKMGDAIDSILPMTEEISRVTLENQNQKDEMSGLVTNVSAVSEELAATTEEVAATTDDFNFSIHSVKEVSKRVLDCVNGLEEQIQKFQL